MPIVGVEDVEGIAIQVFAKTYRRVGPGIYVKTTRVWAEVATESGTVITKEGASNYEVGGPRGLHQRTTSNCVY